MRILLGTNGEPHIQAALPFSLDLLRGSDPTVTLLYVQSNHEAEERATKILGEGKKTIHAFHPQMHVEMRTRKGDVALEILREAGAGEYDLLVVGSKGVSETIAGISEFILSEVIDDVIRYCPISVCVIKEPRPMSRVLLCTDGSPAAERAVGFWGRLKKTREPHVTLLHVVPELFGRFQDVLSSVSEQQLQVLQGLPTKMTQDLHRAKKVLHGSRIEAAIQLREGDVAEEILRESERDYDLVVMGFRGARESARPTLGTQAITVIQKSKIPVLAWKS